MSIYTRDRVERLVPGIWDEWRVLEVPDDLRPDPDMPKSPQVDPRRSTDKVTELADIQRAWANAPLTAGQRIAVLLRHGLDCGGGEMAVLMGISRQKAQERAFDGVTRLLNYLNGTIDDDEELGDDD